MEHYGGKPDPQQYLPQCEPDGQFRYETLTHTEQKTASGLLFLMVTYLLVVSQSSPVLWRDHLLLVCGSGRPGGSWHPIA